jgi:hypothetical protein
MIRPFHIMCAALFASPAIAQRAPSIHAGGRVRLRSAAFGERGVTATVIVFESDTLVLKPDGEAAGLIVPWDSVGDVEIGTWHGHGLEGGLVGLLGGLAVAAAASPCDYDDCTIGQVALEVTYRLMPDPKKRLAVLGALGLVLGAAIGDAAKTETWRPLVRPAVTPSSSGGGVALGLSVSF